jgi:Rieske Fe-S protein
MMSVSRANSCEDCPIIERRRFLRDAGMAVAAIVAALGIAPSVASAAPVEFITALAENRDEKTYPIPTKDGAQIDKSNDAILMRWQGKVYVYSLACPHQNTVIHWSDKGTEFECPKHHSRYLPDGEYVKDSGRATRGLDRFAIRRDGNNIIANLDKLYQQDEDGAQWTAAVITL